MNSSHAISLESTEKQFASFLSEQLRLIIEKYPPANLGVSLAEINDLLGLAKILKVASVKDSRPFTLSEIKALIDVISPFSGGNRKTFAIRAILKEALGTHKIPNDL